MFAPPSLTRSLLTATLLLALAGCQAETKDLVPLAWMKVQGPQPNGALLGPGPTNGFDERSNFTTMAFRDGDTVRLYYGGSDAIAASNTCPGINGTHWRIGLAISTDGVNFNRVAGTATGNALLDNGAGQFDSYLTYRPYVLKDGAVYRMWFNGSTKPFNCNGVIADDRLIGYAESSDGVTWTKPYDGKGPSFSELPLGQPGELDEKQVGYVAVIKDDTEYKMYYSANDSTNTWRVALATSTDARTWTKKRGKLASGAVLDLGDAGSFDYACAYQPAVVKERPQLYRMWYRGCVARNPTTNGPSKGTIGYAESNDGITWVKIPQPTVDGSALGVSPTPAFDSLGLTTPSVFVDGSGWNMYYAGFDATGTYASGLARAAP